MARPYWSGPIQISLVSFGVNLFVATESKSRMNFHQISRTTGERVRHQKVLESTVDSDEAAVVQKDEIVKGYEYRKGQYVTIEPRELEKLRVPSKHVIEISQFVDACEIDPEYVEKPYFIVPENDSQTEAYTIVREALAKTGKVAIGTIAFAGREHIIAIKPAEGSRGMMGYTLRYHDELRKQEDYFRDIKTAKIDEDSLQLAETLIAKRSGKFDPGKFEDGYEVAVKELVEAKVNHLPVPKDETPKTQRNNVGNLMDALRKSISSDSTANKPPKSEKHPMHRGMRLVKPTVKTSSRRKSA